MRNDDAWVHYLLGALMGACIAVAGTAVALQYVYSQTPIVVPDPEVTHKAEPLEAPESPVEAPEPEEVHEDPQEHEEAPVPTSPRRRRKPRPIDINLESDDPLEGI